MSQATVEDLALATSTHIGLVHHTNEDSYTTFPGEDGGHALVVCDGMGGMGRGDEASRIAVDVIEQQLSRGRGFPPDRMRAAVMAADVSIRKQLAVPGNTPGSTAVLTYVDHGLAHVCWAGDSRAYLVRDGVVIARTRDHKLVNELVDAGELTEAEARQSSLAHVVTKALGGRGPSEATIQPDVLAHPWKLRRGDHIVLCSDGLCDLVEDAELPMIMKGLEPQQCVERLTATALDRGGHDNITIIVARWDGEDFDEEAKETPVMGLERDVYAPHRSLNDTWEPSEDEVDAFDDPTTVDVPLDPALEVTVPPPPERDETPTPSARQEPRAAEPTEEPRTRMAIAIAVAALVLIVLAVLVAQGVFTGASVDTIGAAPK
ncbi:MAG: serine/threonine-protein phosphatase [Alphaproteobacteria bacterium]|nr:serine/threonine-protein phosphatase [Alphaproteobacteria bacterium]MCB9690591.1 serine/threonine-protein phosphatase [Alphaproteobacteria bacterium]